MRLIILQNSAHKFFTFPRKHSSFNGLCLLASKIDAFKKREDHKREGVKKHLKDTKLKRPQNKEQKRCIKEFTLEKPALHHSLSCNFNLNVQRHLSIASYAVKTVFFQKLYRANLCWKFLQMTTLNYSKSSISAESS